MFQGYFRKISRVFQKCFKVDLRKFRAVLNRVSRKFQRCFIKVAMVFQECQRCQKEVLKFFLGLSKKIKFFKGVSRFFLNHYCKIIIASTRSVGGLVSIVKLIHLWTYKSLIKYYDSIVERTRVRGNVYFVLEGTGGYTYAILEHSVTRG